MLFSISSVWRGNGRGDAGRPVFSVTYIDSRRIDRIQPQQNRRQFTKRIVTSGMETRTNIDAGTARETRDLMCSATLFLVAWDGDRQTTSANHGATRSGTAISSPNCEQRRQSWPPLPETRNTAVTGLLTLRVQGLSWNQCFGKR